MMVLPEPKASFKKKANNVYSPSVFFLVVVSVLTIIQIKK
jgi:hypothetical protein